MLDLADPDLHDHPDWQAVLQAYVIKQAELVPAPVKRRKPAHRRGAKPDAALPTTALESQPDAAATEQPALAPAESATTIPIAGPVSGDPSEGGGSDESEAESLIGWIPRLFNIPGVPNESLSGIHGQLIAHGLLKVEVGDRQTGVAYQVTTLAKAALLAIQKLAAPNEAVPVAELDADECETQAEPDAALAA